MSNSLPITKIVFYKHGLGFFERKGNFSGNNIKLSFKKKEMNDILKSLNVQDNNPKGKVMSISYDTQGDMGQIIRESSINLGKENSLIDLFSSLRGYNINFTFKGENVSGTVIGLDYNKKRKNFSENFLLIYINDRNEIATYSITDISGVKINDGKALKDLLYFLEKSAGESKKEERALSINLDGEEHDIQINYIASAPTWKVSYRMIYLGKDNKALLKGWGIVNNTLEEDLENVNIILNTGMSISFVYDLYTPKMLSRHEINDEIKRPLTSVPPAESVVKKDKIAPGTPKKNPCDDNTSTEISNLDANFELSRVAEKTSLLATGEKDSHSFSYVIPDPVSIKRGQSAMVPILDIWYDCIKEYIYISKKGEKNPYITLCFKNNSSSILEKGPVTIVEDDTYIGEGIVPFTTKGQMVKLPYAVENDVLVKEEFNNYDSLNSLVFIENAPGNYLFYKEVYHIVESLYTVSNNGDKIMDLIIEHKSYEDGYELFDTQEPFEKTENYFRWKFNLTNRGNYSLKVKERKKLYRSEYYNNLTMDKLSKWLKCHYLDEAGHNALGDIFVLFEQTREMEKWKENLEQEKKQIIEKQKSYREQIQILGDKGDEGNLRKRYISSVEALEDRLDEINKEKDSLSRKLTEIKKKIDKSILDIAKEQKKKSQVDDKGKDVKDTKEVKDVKDPALRQEKAMILKWRENAAESIGKDY